MPQNILLILVLAICWGSSFPLNHLAAETLPPMTMTAARLLIGLGLLALYQVWQGQSLRLSKAARLPCLLMAILGNVIPFYCISLGQQQVPAAETSLMIGLVPIFTLLAAHCCLAGETLTLRKTVGAGIAFTGLLWLFAPQLNGSSDTPWVSYGWVLAAMTGFTVMNLLSSWASTRLQGSDSLAYGMTLYAVPIALVMAYMLEQADYTGFTNREVSLLVLLGCIPTALASILFFQVVTRIGTIGIAMANNLVPVFGITMSALLLKQSLEARLLSAGILIVLGLIVAQGQTKKL